MIGMILFIFAAYYYLSDEKRYISIFILLTIATAGFQLIPVSWMILPSVGITKSYDWLLVFCAIIVLFLPKLFFGNGVWKSYQNIIVFALVLLALLCYSIFYVQVEVSISVRVFRNFIFFIPLFLFINLSIEDLTKVFRWVIYATTIASLIYCLQTFVGSTLLNTVGSDLVTTNEEGTMIRFYNLPVFIFPVIFFFFFSQNILNIKYKYWLMAINFMAIILSQHRNLILSIVVCYLLHLLFSNKLRLSKLVVYVFIALMAFNIGNRLLENRFEKGLTDIKGATVSVSPITLNALSANELSTTEFRWYLFVERLQFVLLEPITSLFGIGFLTEDSRLTNSLRFNIGLPNDQNGITQVDTGDIIWSVMILQFGIVGILFFILYYLSFFVKFLEYKENAIVQIGALYIVILFITSFYGTSILQPYTTCMLMLFAAYTYQLKRENTNEVIMESSLEPKIALS